MSHGTYGALAEVPVWFLLTGPVPRSSQPATLSRLPHSEGYSAPVSPALSRCLPPAQVGGGR